MSNGKGEQTADRIEMAGSQSVQLKGQMDEMFFLETSKMKHHYYQQVIRAWLVVDVFIRVYS